MAFVKKTWKDRITAFPNRRVIDDGITSKTVTVSRSEGAITEAGTPFNATEMNDLEDRIEAAIAGGDLWTDITGTLLAGETSVTLTSVLITESSTIDYYTEYFGINPVGASVTNGRVTLTFEAQEVDIGVKVRVS